MDDICLQASEGSARNEYDGSSALGSAEKKQKRRSKETFFFMQSDMFAHARWTGMASESVVCTRAPCECEINRAAGVHQGMRSCLFCGTEFRVYTWASDHGCHGDPGEQRLPWNRK